MEIVNFWSGIDMSGILLDLLIYDFRLLKKRNIILLLVGFYGA